MLNVILHTILILGAAFLIATALRELKSYMSLSYLSAQGIKTLYYPIAGLFWLLRLQKGSNDQLAELRKTIKNFKDDKAFAINFSYETNPVLVLLDDDLIRDFFMKEIGNTVKWLHVENLNRGFSLHNGDRAFEARGIYSNFFNHDNLVNISARVAKTIDRAMQEFELKEFHGKPSCEVFGKAFITKSMCYLINCVVLGEDEKIFDPKDDLSETIVDYNSRMYYMGNSVQNMATWGLFHRYNIFPESRALWKDLQFLESEIYARYLRRQSTKPQADPNIIDSLVEFNKKQREQGKPELDKKEISGHWFLFQLAGIDTTMHLVVYALQVLSHDMKLQETMRKGVDDLYESKKGQTLSYEDYTENELIEQFANELIRIGSPAAVLNLRKATQEFSVGSIKVKTGTSILIPAGVNMNSERFYKDPDTFDIDRMTKDNIKKIKRAGFMPFGQGRRVCPGRVLGELMTRILIIQTLRKYVVEPSPNSDESKVFGIVYGYKNPQFILKKRSS